MHVKRWLICAEFNSVFNCDDRIGGRPVSASELVDANQSFSLGLADELKRCGSNFT